MLDAADILANVIVEGMQENKAKEIVSLNLKKLKQLFVIISSFVTEHLTPMFQP